MWNNAGSFLAPRTAPADGAAPADIGSQIQSSESSGGENDFELPEEFVVRVPQQTPCVLKITRRDAHHGVETEHASDDDTNDSFFAAGTAQAPRTALGPRLIHTVMITISCPCITMYVRCNMYVADAAVLADVCATGSTKFGRAHVATLLFSSH